MIDKPIVPNTIENIETTISEPVDNLAPNCLALTVRKDYNLTIFKNIATESSNIFLKILFSSFVINFLKMFL